MTIKKIVFEVQSALSKAHGITIKRSHVHEMLAALYGHASYAALTKQCLLAQYIGSGPSQPLDIVGAASRAQGLGYAPPAPPIIASVAADAAQKAHIFVVTVDDVLAALGVDGWQMEEDRDDKASVDLESPLLRESLLRLAYTDNASAHLALALFDDELVEEESTTANDGSYWFEQQKSGRELVGVELEWADRYRQSRDARSSREEHLRRAAALGNPEASMLRAEERRSDETFEEAVRLAGDRYPAQLGDVGMVLGRKDEARNLLRAAAREGDTDAMKTLASELEHDLKDAWIWVHLATLLGVDVMAYHAVSEDGMPADADEAGPLYAAGGFHLDERGCGRNLGRVTQRTRDSCGAQWGCGSPARS